MPACFNSPTRPQAAGREHKESTIIVAAEAVSHNNLQALQDLRFLPTFSSSSSIALAVASDTDARLTVTNLVAAGELLNRAQPQNYIRRLMGQLKLGICYSLCQLVNFHPYLLASEQYCLCLTMLSHAVTPPFAAPVGRPNLTW